MDPQNIHPRSAVGGPNRMDNLYHHHYHHHHHKQQQQQPSSGQRRRKGPETSTAVTVGLTNISSDKYSSKPYEEAPKSSRCVDSHFFPTQQQQQQQHLVLQTSNQTQTKMKKMYNDDFALKHDFSQDRKYLDLVNKMDKQASFPQTFNRSPTGSPLTSDSQERMKITFLGEKETPLFGRVIVELLKGDGSNLGLTVSDGSEIGEPPVIVNIRSGSIADRSDALLPYDRILSMNSVSTTRSKHDQSIRLPKSSGSKVRMEIEYELPELPPAGCTVKHMQVDLNIGMEGVGLVIRGGWDRSPTYIRPLTVMHVRKNSAADCDGRIKPGDRILAINNVHTGQLTCEEAMKLIAATRHRLNLAIEYNVANFDTDRSVAAAVIVEIEKPCNEDLGISLAPCHEVKTGQNAFFIDFIRQGSIADRCGALFIGDRVEAIDDICVEDLILQEAMHRLKNNGLDSVRLQIVPNAMTNLEKPTKSTPITTSQRNRSRPRRHAFGSPTETPNCLCESENQRTTEFYRTEMHNSCPSGSFTEDVGSNLRRHSLAKSLTSLHSLFPARSEVCRCEEVEVRLEPSEHMNYGFTLVAPPLNSTSSATDNELIKFPIIDHVDPRGAAFKSGVIQEGDRVICMNGQSTLNQTIEDLISEFIEPNGFDPKLRRLPPLTLLTQYTVADNVVPTAGIFDVKLVKRAASLGINLQASINKQGGQPLLISKVIPGSVASRSGSISPGDVLLAVNGVHLSSCSLSEAIRLLQSQKDEVVTLRIQKIESYPLMEERTTNRNFNFQSKDESLYVTDEPMGQTTVISDKLRDPKIVEDFPFIGHRDQDEVLNFDSKSKRKDESKLHANRSYVDTSNSYLRSYVPPQPIPSVTSTHVLTKPSLNIRADNQTQTDRSTSSGQDESRTEQTGISDIHIPSGSGGGITTPSGAAEIISDSLNHRDRILRTKEMASSKSEDFSLDGDHQVIRVVLRRKSSECSWGIIICGGDKSSDMPIIIDSLTPGDPGELCGLLRSGDRILAINGTTLHSGHTLTQAMRMLQHYPDRVTLHVSRFVPLGPDTLEVDSTRISKFGEVPRSNMEFDRQGLPKSELSRKCSLKKVVAMSNFSRSFDSISNSLGSNTPPTTTSDHFSVGIHTSQTLSGINALTLTNSSTRSNKQTNVPLRSISQTKMSTTTTTTANPVNVTNPNETNPDDDWLRSSLNPKVVLGKLPTRNLSTRSHDKPGNWRLLPSVQYSDTSEVNEQVVLEEGDSNLISAKLMDYAQLDLDFIQCPGCREAIANEIKLRLKQQTESVEIKRRARSQQRSFDGCNSSITKDLGKHKISHRGLDEKLTVRSHSSRTTNQTGKPIFYCPGQESINMADSETPDSVPEQNSVKLITERHSKSDSRLNLFGLGDASTEDMELVEPASYTMGCPSRMGMTESNMEERSHNIRSRHSSSHNTNNRNIPQTNTIAQISPTIDYGSKPNRIIPSASQWTSKRDESIKDMTPANPKSKQRDYPTGHSESGGWCTWIRLKKPSPTDSYGIGVSEGLSTMGTFVSAIRPNSPADKSGLLHLYDRILMVNDQLVDGLTCTEVVELISRSERTLDLLIQRRTTRKSRQCRQISSGKSTGSSRKSIGSSRSGLPRQHLQQQQQMLQQQEESQQSQSKSSTQLTNITVL